jgi:predicted ArsR family transcriptional regulator
VERAGRPGRPRLLYTPAPDSAAADGYRVLTEVLSEEWEQDPDSGRRRAERAGRRWAAAHLEPASGISLDRALDEVNTLFDRLGFAPRRADLEGGHRFLLDACPFRDVARRHTEVVCTVHLGLLRGALDRLGLQRAESQLRPFVEPELCVADVRFPAPATPGSETRRPEL